jgi:NAD(P)-dependent dehydrogenase (short-subunit alcohol dehydrogenase family)
MSRVVLITNVTQFVGPAAVRRLLADGARVVAHDASFADAKARAAWTQGLPGAISATLLAALAQKPAALVAEAVAAFGRIDAVLSNDEFPALRAPLEEAKLEDLRASLEALAVQPFALAQAAVPQLKRQGGGRIVLVTSAAPLRGLANYGMYATARGAANALTLTLARELAPSAITVNAVAPNYVENPSYFPPALTSNPEAMAKMLRHVPLGRLGKPEEVAALIAFFCLGDCDFVTGHVVPIAGGWA